MFTEFCLVLTGGEVYIKVKHAARNIKLGSVLFCSVLNVFSIKQGNRFYKCVVFNNTLLSEGFVCLLRKPM